jgi:hypothetical protein
MAALAAVAVTGAPIILAPALQPRSPPPPAPPTRRASRAHPAARREDDLPAANSARVTIMHVCIVLGPVIARGCCSSAARARLPLNCATFLAGATAVAALPRTALRRPEAAGRHPGCVRSCAAAGCAARYPDALPLFGAEVVASVAYGALTVLFVLLSDRLGLGAAGTAT